MKDVLTVVTFVIWVLCFAVFLMAVTPDELSAAGTEQADALQSCRLPVRRGAIEKPAIERLSGHKLAEAANDKEHEVNQ